MAMKLLFVVPEDWYFVTHRLPLARAAIASGYEVHVATRVTEAGRRIVEAGCVLHQLNWPRHASKPWLELGVVPRVAGLLRALKPDIVHYVALKAVVFGNAAERLARSRNVRLNAIAGLGFLFSDSSARTRLLKAGALHALRSSLDRPHSLTVVQNDDDREALLKSEVVSEDQIRLIRGAGVETDEFVVAPFPASPVVLLASRMLWDKGIKEFIDAAHMLKPHWPDVRFLLAGAPDPGSPGTITEDQLRTWVEGGDVEWLGRRDDMPALLAQSSLVCLPSAYREGIPKVLLEAAAAGRPIITTDMPGCRDVVRDGWNGLLVPPRNARALADAIGRLLGDRAICGVMGARSRERAVQEFSAASVHRQTLDLYVSLLGSR